MKNWGGGRLRNDKFIMTNITAGSEISTDGIAVKAAAHTGGWPGACGWPDPPLTPNAMLSTLQLPSNTLTTQDPWLETITSSSALPNPGTLYPTFKVTGNLRLSGTGAVACSPLNPPRPQASAGAAHSSCSPTAGYTEPTGRREEGSANRCLRTSDRPLRTPSPFQGTKNTFF